ncbi:MAG: hypothetical protein NZ920_02490 [Aigarchaeota archaeon]|nr:hypothetical protein [Aigarchaeota archaeon]MDW8092507.1 hypothetical protein [Nitrososphaerota archaeon]
MSGKINTIIIIGLLATLLIAGLVIGVADAAGPQMDMFRGWGRRFGNLTGTQEEVSIVGTLVDMGPHTIVVRSSSGDVKLWIAQFLQVDNQVVSTIKLVFDGRLRKGDVLEIKAVKVTFTLANGQSNTALIVKSLLDQSTGLKAEVPTRSSMRPTMNSWHSMMC